MTFNNNTIKHLPFGKAWLGFFLGKAWLGFFLAFYSLFPYLPSQTP